MASRLVTCVFILFAAFLSSPPVRAQVTAEPFTIHGVEVDVTASSANAAKEQAIADGQRQAFQSLLERLTNPADRGRLPKVDGADYDSDYSIESERASAVRYIATLNVRFNAAAVRKLLKTAAVTMIEPVVHPVVVIPVWRNNGQVVVWEDGNPWRAAWQSQGKGGLVAIVVPTAADGALPSVEQVIAADDTELGALGGRYHTSEVLVMTADLSGDGHKVEVTAAVTRGAPFTVDAVSLTAKSGETTDQMLGRAVRDLMQSIEKPGRLRRMPFRPSFR